MRTSTLRWGGGIAAVRCQQEGVVAQCVQAQRGNANPLISNAFLQIRVLQQLEIGVSPRTRFCQHKQQPLPSGGIGDGNLSKQCFTRRIVLSGVCFFSAKQQGRPWSRRPMSACTGFSNRAWEVCKADLVQYLVQNALIGAMCVN